MCVHGVPPVQGRLIHAKGVISPSHSLTSFAICFLFSSLFKSLSSVNCRTVQPTAHLRSVSLNLDSEEQQISMINLLASGKAEGPPVQGARSAALEGRLAVLSWGLDSISLSVIARSLIAFFHFSEFANGLVKTSAAWSWVGPWTNLYHLRLNCSSSQDKLTRCVLSVRRNVGDFPFSRILIVAWLSSMNTPLIECGA